MRRFVTFNRWSTWSRSSRRHWGCTLVWMGSDESLLKILQSVIVAFHTRFYKSVVFIIFVFFCLYSWRVSTRLNIEAWIRVKVQHVNFPTAYNSEVYKTEFQKKALFCILLQEFVAIWCWRKAVRTEQKPSSPEEAKCKWLSHQLPFKYQHKKFKSNSLRCEDELA